MKKVTSRILFLCIGLSLFLISNLLYSQRADSLRDVEPEVTNHSQNDSKTFVKKYHVKITLANGQKVKGIIKSIGEESVQLEKVVYKKSGEAPLQAHDGSLPGNEIRYSSIKEIRVRSLKATVRGTAAGMGIGSVLGAAGGLLLSLALWGKDHDPHSSWAEDYSGMVPFAAVLGAGLFGTLGAIDGPYVIRFEIAGNYYKFQGFRNGMEAK